MEISMIQQADLPEEAVERVLDRRNIREQEDTILSPVAAVRDDLKAAAPAIRKQERERVREALLSDKAKAALFDANRRYQNVDPREQSEDGWADALLRAALNPLEDSDG